MKTALCALIFSCALIASPVSYAQTGNPAAATTSGNSGAAHPHYGPCHEDVQKLCSTVPKGGGKVLDCLKEHVGQLSPRCEAAMKRHAADKQGAAPAGSAPATK